MLYPGNSWTPDLGSVFGPQQGASSAHSAGSTGKALPESVPMGCTVLSSKGIFSLSLFIGCLVRFMFAFGIFIVHNGFHIQGLVKIINLFLGKQQIFKAKDLQPA